MSNEDETVPVPNWLLKLEEQRARRLKVKLGHEAGAGALCQKCGDKCPGLDLHFWRKICKQCKCGKEDHDITDDDMFGFVQFQLLGSKPVKSKGLFLKDRKDEVILEWTPKGSSNDVKKYLNELPADMIPVKGSEAAKIRKQRLQKQMPAHDIDHTLCHNLTEDEIKELEEYVAHIRKHCVGQGKIIRLSLLKANHHKLANPNAHFLSQYPPAQVASSQTVFLQSSDLANNLHNLNLRDKPVSNTTNNRSTFLNSQVPNENIINNSQEQNPTLLGKPHDIVYSAGNTESVNSLRNKSEYPNFAAKSMHQIIDNQHPVSLPTGKVTDLNYTVNQDFGLPNSNVGPQNPNFGSQMPAGRHNLNYGSQNIIAGSQNALGSQNLLGSQNTLSSQNPLGSQILLGSKNPSGYQNSNYNMQDVQNPNFSSQNPNFGFQNPNFNSENPKFGSQNPKLDSQSLEQNPNLGSQNTSLGSQNSNFVSQNPTLGSQNPNFDSQNPNSGFQNTNLGYHNPNLGFQNPNQDSQNLNFGSQNSNFNSQNPNLGSQNTQNLDSQHPNLSSQNTNLGSSQTSQTQKPSHYSNPLLNPTVYEQNPSILNAAKTIHYPLTTSNVEKHQEQFENPNSALNYELNNANVDRILKPHLNFAPNFINPIEQHQMSTVVGQPKDMKYPNNTGISANDNKIEPNYTNYPSDHNQKGKIGQLKDVSYPDCHQPGLPTQDPNFPGNYPNSNLSPNQFNPNYFPDSGSKVVGQGNYPEVGDTKYPINNANIDKISNTGLIYNPNFISTSNQIQNPTHIGQLKDINYPANNVNLVPNQHYPNNLQMNDQNYPINDQNNSKFGQFADQNFGHNPSAIFDPNSQPNFNPENIPAKNQNFGHNPTAVIYDPNLQPNVNLDSITSKPQNQDVKQVSHDILSQDLKHRPQIPVLEAQNAINPFETHLNLQSVGYIRDIDYKTENNLPASDLYDVVNQNNVVPSCHECKKIFEDGSVAVSAERTSNLWHASCFNCFTCKQPLADLLYFYHKDTDNIYCGRDYAILKGIPRCAACDELIFVREYCLAEDSTFHIKHFCCFECDEPLAGKQYVMENNQPLCLVCYENVKAEKCNDCGNVIRPDEQGVSLQNLHWHADQLCFACKYCRKPLLGNKMLLRNNNLFCSDVCFKTFR